MTLPAVIATERLSLPLWAPRDVAAMRGDIARSPHWHAAFPSSAEVELSALWNEGDGWGRRSIVRGATVLGSIGFAGSPEAAPDGVPEVEVDLILVREAEEWGFGVEALRGLAHSAEAVGVRVRGCVAPTAPEALTVFRRAGFTQLRGANASGEMVMVRPFAAHGLGDPKPLAVTIRPTVPEDWVRLRGLRLLHAREHSPSWRYDEDETGLRPEEEWRAEAGLGNTVETGCLVAVHSATQRWVGIIAVHASDEHGESPIVEGLFVPKQFRGRTNAIADQLLAPSLSWAARRSEVVRAWAYDGSPAALRFFARHGFTPTGRTKPLVESHPDAGTMMEISRRLR